MTKSRVEAALERALALHHTEPTPYMQFRLPVDPLASDSHCNQISDLLDEQCSPWERRVATPTLWKQLPACRGLYMFAWRPKLELTFAEDPNLRIASPHILYVGQAGGGPSSENDIQKRYRGEYAKYVAADPEALWSTDVPVGRSAKLKRFLTLSPLEFWWCSVKDSTQILRLESRLNWMLSPPLGTQGRARLVATDAFTPPKSKKVSQHG